MRINEAKSIGDNLLTIVESYLGPPVKNQVWFCPFHDDTGNPNLTVNGERFRCWSARCNRYGDVLDWIQQMENTDLLTALNILTKGRSPDPAEIAQRKLEYEAHQAQRQKEIRATRQAAIDSMSSLESLVDRYHSRLDNNLLHWQTQGLTGDTARSYKLGYCNACPTYYNPNDPSEKVPSHTIPYFQAGKLLSIRHRLSRGNQGRYRQHKKGLPNLAFNVDSLTSPNDKDEFQLLDSILKDNEAMLLEGEVKSMFAVQEGARNIGIPGALTWVSGWAKYFKGMSRVYICLDYDVLPSVIIKIANDLLKVIKEVFIVELTAKIDDFFIIYGGTTEQFKYHVKYARSAGSYV